MDTTITFRDARREDVAAIVAMYADDDLGATRESPGEPLPDAYWRAFEQIEADRRHRLLVAERDGELVATLQLSLLPCLTLRGTTRAQIESVRVSGSVRGQGVGRELVTHAIELAREAGAGLVQLTTNATRDDARRFYESLGFAATHHGMKRDLAARD